MSYAEERDLFNRLALFAGPFDVDAAVKVSPYTEVETVQIVDGLVLKSLLIPERYQTGRRFRMLETLRQYGIRRLEKRDLSTEARDALLGWAHLLAIDIGPKLKSPDQIQAVQQLDLDINSIRSAMNWALESGQVEPGLDATIRYWYLRALLRRPSTRQAKP